MNATLPGLDPATYVAHSLHAGTRHWPETNCYVDLWIEVLHSLALEPTAALGFTIGLDYEGDQFTFYKLPLPDLQYLYGIEVRELNVWQPILRHATDQVALGRLFIMDVDSFYLPDTTGVSYQREHVKSAIAIQHVDVPAQQLGYFHGTGYHVLSGEDFQGMFRLGEEGGEGGLPPYAEIAKLAHAVRLPDAELVRRSLVLFRRHLADRPCENPVRAHRARLEETLPGCGVNLPRCFTSIPSQHCGNLVVLRTDVQLSRVAGKSWRSRTGGGDHGHGRDRVDVQGAAVHAGARREDCRDGEPATAVRSSRSELGDGDGGARAPLWCLRPAAPATPGGPASSGSPRITASH